jgi:hypothetical protein
MTKIRHQTSPPVGVALVHTHSSKEAIGARTTSAAAANHVTLGNDAIGAGTTVHP